MSRDQTTSSAAAVAARHEALSARLGAALRAGADPQRLLHDALQQLRSAARPRWLDYAQAFSALGAHPLAAALLGQAVTRWPQDAELRFRLGNALRLSQRHSEAEREFRETLRLNPGHEPAALSLSFMLRDAGRIDAACAEMLALWGRQGGAAEAALKAGRFLDECGRPQWASRVYREALARTPQDPHLLAAAGDMAMVLGDFDRGRECLLAALDGGIDARDWSGICLLLANNQRYVSADHPDFVRFARAWDSAASFPDSRIAAGFALGKARADVGDFSGAVEVLRQANALQRNRRPWSAAGWRNTVEALIAAPPTPQAAGDTRLPGAPLFVVGLPRTGTTLVAELLGRHAQVRNRGEMNWLPFLAQELTTQRRLDSPPALRRAASIYLAQLRQDDAAATWYLDKNPHNFRHLGLIAGLFPQARIIHCVRERRDTALSIWSQLFAHQDVDYAYDFADIAAFADGHDRLMRHWRQSLQLPVFELEYEQLVGQTEATLRRLADFLGLPAEEVCNAQQRDSVISTASVWQARQPVHRAAVGRWRRYLPYLPELSEHFAV